MKRFYDTNILLHVEDLDDIEGKVYLASTTILELESIKTSRNKDDEIKFKSRRALRHIMDNEDKYEIVIIRDKNREILQQFHLDETNDNLIISVAYLESLSSEVEFITNDVLAYQIAKNIFELKCERLDIKDKDDYKGFVTKQLMDDELGYFYQNLKRNTYGLLENQYLIIKDSEGRVIDSYKWNGEELKRTDVQTISSTHLGNVKPLDRYQMCVVDSLQSNQITMVKGKAGSGKSYIAMAYLFNQLEKGRIDRIIMFVNPTKVRGSVELGYYTGDKNDKLMQGSIGSFLSSKIGDMAEVEDLMFQNKIILLPMSDIRGYQVPTNSAVYIMEAQNTSIDLMRLCLQRISEDSIVIIDGDYNSQVDDYSYQANNGMKRMSEVFRGESLYGEVELQKIFRSKIADISDRM